MFLSTKYKEINGEREWSLVSFCWFSITDPSIRYNNNNHTAFTKIPQLLFMNLLKIKKESEPNNTTGVRTGNYFLIVFRIPLNKINNIFFN